MKNVNIKRKTMGEVQTENLNKLFNMESCILNDVKGEIIVWEKNNIIFDIFKKSNKNMSKGLGIGKIGKGSHIRIIKFNEFKKELAPTHAKIEEVEIAGVRAIKMTY